MASWTFVPKPRSAIKTVEWLPSLVKLEGQFWNKKDQYGNHPVRREYLKLAHPFEEFKDADPEINARMEFARFQTLGFAYLDKSENDLDAKIVITKAGKLMATSENKEELMLRQLLKWQFPSNIHSSRRFSSMRVFPLEIIIRVLEEFKKINKMELGFSIFSCKNIEEIEAVFDRIRKFRELVKGKPADKHKDIFYRNFRHYNEGIDNRPETYLGNYDDVIFRYLEYTSIFETSGRGEFTKLYVPERSSIKFKQLAEKYSFKFFEEYDDKEKFYGYFGDPFACKLPWETKEALEEIVKNRLEILRRPKRDTSRINFEDLKLLEEKLDGDILSKNEREFVLRESKTWKVRKSIIEKFIEIDQGDEDAAALWLEVNTWKSLVAMRGSHYVKRNFKIELDLSPRSFAPGIGNTPDMEFYNKRYIIIPEVSIQSGVQQWVTEGAAVVEHVLKFLQIKKGEKFLGIEKINKHLNSQNIQSIYGLFLCKKINNRLLWQFYILNRETWIGEPVPVVPLEIKEYIKIIEYMYKNNIPAIEFEQLLEGLAKSSLETDDYSEWLEKYSEMIKVFVKNKKAG